MVIVDESKTNTIQPAGSPKHVLVDSLVSEEISHRLKLGIEHL